MRGPLSLGHPTETRRTQVRRVPPFTFSAGRLGTIVVPVASTDECGRHPNVRDGRNADAVVLLAMTIGPHAPRAVHRLHETERLRGGGVAENFGEESRIDSFQTARPHRAAALGAVVVAILRGRSRGAEDAQDGGDRKQGKSLPSTGTSLPSTHDKFLLFCRHRCCQLNLAFNFAGRVIRRRGNAQQQCFNSVTNAINHSAKSRWLLPPGLPQPRRSLPQFRCKWQ
jgi:hypothetical protein